MTPPFFFPEFSLCPGVLPILSYLAIGHSFFFYYTNHSNTSSNSVQISHNSFHYKRAAILWGQAWDILVWMWNALDRLMCWMLCPWLVMLFMEENISLWEMTKVQVVFGPSGLSSSFCFLATVVWATLPPEPWTWIFKTMSPNDVSPFFKLFCQVLGHFIKKFLLIHTESSILNTNPKS